MSALLAVGTVHRPGCGPYAQSNRSGDRNWRSSEVHHHCLLVGYGADAINPYLTFEALWDSLDQGKFNDVLTSKTITMYYEIP